MHVEAAPAYELALTLLHPKSEASRVHDPLLSMRAQSLCVASCRVLGRLLLQLAADSRVQQGQNTEQSQAQDYIAVQVWVEYARWHAADGGGGPQQAASILARARKVNICSALHAFDGCYTVMLTGTACLLLAYVLRAPKPAVDLPESLQSLWIGSIVLNNECFPVRISQKIVACTEILHF